MSDSRGREFTMRDIRLEAVTSERDASVSALSGPQCPPLVHKQHFRALLMGEWRPSCCGARAVQSIATSPQHLK